MNDRGAAPQGPAGHRCGRVFVALVHHPVRDGAGETITTAVTNLDVHDTARLARSYDVDQAFLVTPISAQRELIRGVVDHWEARGPGARNADRLSALRRLRTVARLDDAQEAAQASSCLPLRTLATAADPRGRATVSFSEAREVLTDSAPTLIVFGTGHGLADSVLDGADGLLAPIRGAAGYNHLSVRTAMAICLDRLLGERVR